MTKHIHNFESRLNRFQYQSRIGLQAEAAQGDAVATESEWLESKVSGKFSYLKASKTYPTDALACALSSLIL